MVTRICFVEGVEFNPAICYVLIVVLVEEHLTTEWADGEIAAFVTAPWIGVFAAFRDRFAQTDFIVREVYKFVSKCSCAFEIFISTAEHFFR